MQRYPKEISEFLATNAAGLSTAELTKITNDRFGTSYRTSQIRAYKKNHKLKSGNRPGVREGTPTKLYPAEVREFIQASYVGVGHQGMADLLNAKFGTHYTKGQMKAWYARMKLNSGRTGRFPKGHKAVRSFKKGEHVSRETEFWKGHMPHNYKPVGTEIWRHDRRRNSDGKYLYVKVAEPNVWVPKHRLIWEEAYGLIPDGIRIVFADRNPENLSLDNLIAISGSELVRMNQKGLFFDAPDATRVGVSIAKLITRSGELLRKKKSDTKEEHR